MVARNKEGGLLSRIFGRLCDACGLQTTSRSRRVRFEPQAAVYEFERQLAGGGGVPDGDPVALGLGSRCISSYLSPLLDRQNKDEYAMSGYLDPDERTRLLSEWSPRPAIKRSIEKDVGPEISRLQKAREETASSPRDQRFMPSSIDDAVMLGARDHEAARKATSTRLRCAPAPNPRTRTRSRAPAPTHPLQPRSQAERFPPRQSHGAPAVPTGDHFARHQ